jgi:cytosine/adenosine deaminase-related metal-dependent hydrolase
MKRFSAQFIITNSGSKLKRGIISTHDDGTIISVEDTLIDLREEHSVEYHNGIIVPGFVNCHCHLELSHMKGSINPGGSLGGFLTQINNTRAAENDTIISSAKAADNDMYKEGISLCGDICNTSNTFRIKKESAIKYINLIEVFGINPEKASRRMDEGIKVSEVAEEMELPWSFVPHSSYSMSQTLFRLIREKSKNNRVTSIHFMESAGEKNFIEEHSGDLMETYRKAGFIPSRPEMVKDHTDAVLNEVTPSGNLVLVHNTFADSATIRAVKKRDNLFWCLCPNSNEYIENTLPPVDLLINEKCEIVLGTDSLASNTKLSIISEMISLQKHSPSLSIEELVKWATINGARALGEEDNFGKIEVGKTPGLLLLQNVDLINMKFLPDSYATRLI